MSCSSRVDLSCSKNCLESCHPAKHQRCVLCLIAPVSWFIGQNPASKICMQERSWNTFMGSVHEMEHWFNRKSFTCSFSSFWSTSLFMTIHHQAHKPLPQQLKSHSFCPSWWEETLFCNMVKIFQVLYHPEQDQWKTPHNFSSSSMKSLQLYYADLLYISLYFTFLFFPISFKLLPLCTSELCWSQRSNRLKTCVQVKWLHLWPQTIPSWEHLICSNQMYFYFNGMPLPEANCVEVHQICFHFTTL